MLVFFPLLCLDSGVVRASLFRGGGCLTSRFRNCGSLLWTNEFSNCFVSKVSVQTASINAVRACPPPVLKKGLVGVWDFRFL